MFSCVPDGRSREGRCRRSLIYDGVAPLEKEFLDQQPTPQPKSGRAPEPAYESSADPTGEGPMLATAACGP